MKNISEGCKWMHEPKNVFYAQNQVYSIRFKVRLFARILWLQAKQAYIEYWAYAINILLL